MAVFRKIEICSWEIEYPSLSDDLKAVFSPTEKNAYVAGARYFIRLAERSEEPNLASLLRKLDEDAPMRVYLERQDNSPWLVWFGFAFPITCGQPHFRLPTALTLPRNAPKRIRRIYSAFGGIRDDAGTEYGIQPPEFVKAISECEWDVIDGNCNAPDSCFVFFSLGNGDHVGWDDSGCGVLFDHERSTVKRCDLDQFLDRFFSELCERDFELPQL